MKIHIRTQTHTNKLNDSTMCVDSESSITSEIRNEWMSCINLLPVYSDIYLYFMMWLVDVKLQYEYKKGYTPQSCYNITNFYTMSYRGQFKLHFLERI